MFDVNPVLQVFLTFLTAYTLCRVSIPSIIKVAKLKQLFDAPNYRKQHFSNIPTFGGIGIFASFLFSVTFWSNQSQIVELQYIISALLIMFFIGIKDDIVNLVAYKKLFGQIVSASILVIVANIRLSSFYGLFGVYDVNYFTSVIISVFVIIGIMNSFNLIDGIDTLCSLIGSLTCLIFGTWFYLVGEIQYAILSSAMIGSLLAFYKYNKSPPKIFMGDTGSIVLGLINSIIAIKFIEMNKSFSGPSYLKVYSVPAVAIGILIVPLYDTMRVFLIRIFQQRSPLSSDRNHIHHLLIDRGFSHIQSSYILFILNLFIIVFSFIFQRIEGEILLFINLLFMTSFTFIIQKKKKLTPQLKESS